MPNPLLKTDYFPEFDQIKPQDVIPAIDALLEQNRKDIDELLENPPKGWALIEALEAIDDRLSQVWSPVSHMNAVVNSDELREAYNAALPKLSEYHTWMGQNEKLFYAYQQLAESEAFNSLDKAQQQLINNALRDFRLSGIDLEPEAKQRYGELQQKLSELQSKVSEQVLDATGAWSKQFDSAEPLKGLPETALSLAKQTAEQKGQSGYVITLDFPSYFAVMSYADDRALRQEVYTAFCTRASDQGPNAGKWDNAPIIDEILKLRHELAQLLGFDNYAEYSLATKMADSADQVIDFLRDLADKSVPAAQWEADELRKFANMEDGIQNLEAWDVTYYTEKLRQNRYSISQEELRPYFPVEKVLSGLFEVAKRLFDIDITKAPAQPLWHNDARLYQLVHGGEVIGYFYLDLYARDKKRGGAWMDECRVRRRLPNGQVQLPMAYLVCNFNPPVGDTPALLTHDEVTTLFHEFGHGIHHLLTKMEWAGISGINGVAWDAVELPSQFLENWCWQPEALALISGHYEIGEPLPQDLLDKMLAAKHFQSGMMMVRQLEFSLFDLVLHKDYCPEPPTDVQAVLNRVRSEVAVIQVPEFNRFQNSFTHIFAGGYAAGYYSYKWAEVLSADVFTRFQQEGIFNTQTGQDYLNCILSQGGSTSPMEMFVNFMGREPDVEALLRQEGIITDEEETERPMTAEQILKEKGQIIKDGVIMDAPVEGSLEDFNEDTRH